MGSKGRFSPSKTNTCDIGALSAHCRASGCPGKVILDNVPERFPFFGSSTGSSQQSLFNHCPQSPGLDRSPRSAYCIRSERSNLSATESGQDRASPPPKGGSGFLTRSAPSKHRLDL